MDEINRRRSSAIRSMSATEIVTCPEMTTPLSRTRSSKSLRTSRASESSDVSSSAVAASGRLTSRVIAIGLHEVIHWPGSAELEPESGGLQAFRESADGRPKCRVRLGRDEKRGVEGERGTPLGHIARHRNTPGGNRVVGERLVDVARRLVGDAARLGLALGVELALEEVPLTR